MRYSASAKCYTNSERAETFRSRPSLWAENRDHRAWSTGLVSGVAYAPRISVARSASSADDAPVAQLVAAIGLRSAGPEVAKETVNPTHWMAWLFIFLSLALIGEIASRRLRGAR
jgi:hypothetical protein